MTNERNKMIASMAKTVKLDGKSYVILPADEYQALRERATVNLPPLPPPNAKGRYPARETIRANIARSIIQRRLDMGLTQEALAEMVGIRKETLSRIESGKHRPQTATIEKIGRVLNI